jgi:hypothetical protein
MALTTVDVELRIGATNETVTVTSAAPELATSNASLGVAAGLSSRPEEFHLQPLTDPYVNLSIHTALHSDQVVFSRKRPLSVVIVRFLLVTQLTRTTHLAMSSPSLHGDYSRFDTTIG